MKISTVYIVQYKNLLITLTFSETSTFWQTYTMKLDDVIAGLTQNCTSLTQHIGAIYDQLENFGLESVEVLDRATGSGMRYANDKPKKK